MINQKEINKASYSEYYGFFYSHLCSFMSLPATESVISLAHLRKTDTYIVRFKLGEERR